MLHRLDAAAFTPSKSQRQLLSRFSHFVIDGGREGTPGWGPAPSTSSAPAGSSTTAAHPTKSDSMLSAAKSVTFNPSSKVSISDDEANAEFKVPSAKKGKRKAGDVSERAAVEKQASELGAKGKAKAKGKGRGAPIDLGDMVHEGEWSRNGDDKTFKHRFEVSWIAPSRLQRRADLSARS